MARLTLACDFCGKDIARGSNISALKTIYHKHRNECRTRHRAGFLVPKETK